MVRVPRPVVPGARMVLTVHDELAFEVPAEAVDEAKAKVREAMESVFPLDVPLVVDVGHGPTWARATLSGAVTAAERQGGSTATGAYGVPGRQNDDARFTLR
ncbi:pseudogene [Sorangium cellulosum So ce56]|nr:pseudogene [Sorangium cellulosum So ce56]